MFFCCFVGTYTLPVPDAQRKRERGRETDRDIKTWTFQILGNSRNSGKRHSFCWAKRCQIDQNSLLDWISLKFNDLWMSQATRFCMTCGLIFSFWPSKMPRITRKTPATSCNKCQTPAKKVKLLQIPKSHATEFSGTQLIESFTAKQMQGHWEIRWNSWNSELY